MMISTHGRYALRVLADLAENQGDGYVTLREIAGRQEISEKYLESIVKELVRAGMLVGLRGKGGGYRLGRTPEQLNILDVLRVMEGTLAPVACLAEDGKPCERAAVCRTLPLWTGLDKVVTEYLRRYTVADLIHTEPDSIDHVP